MASLETGWGISDAIHEAGVKRRQEELSALEKAVAELPAYVTGIQEMNNSDLLDHWYHHKVNSYNNGYRLRRIVALHRYTAYRLRKELLHRLGSE